jgi:hypothetical protein
MALDVEGRPICCEMWPGNTADVKTLIPIAKRMKERFRLREITVVADRGMVSKRPWKPPKKSEPPVRYIVGVRMRRQKEVNTSVLGSRARWFESVPERSNAKDPAPKPRNTASRAIAKARISFSVNSRNDFGI